jgi:hypothetical protein
MRKLLVALLLLVLMLAGVAEMSGCRSRKASPPAAARKVRKPRSRPAKKAPAKEAEKREGQTDPQADPEGLSPDDPDPELE